MVSLVISWEILSSERKVLSVVEVVAGAEKWLLEKVRLLLRSQIIFFAIILVFIILCSFLYYSLLMYG